MAWRISNESGDEAGKRNFGRLALSFMPWALAIGAAAWLSFYVGVRSVYRQVEQERRAAVAVGAPQKLTAPFKITIREQEFCSPVTRAEIDGRILRLYATGTCAKETSSMSWYYQLVSPNGTVLHEDDKWTGAYNNESCTHPRFRGDAAECVIFDVPVEQRASEIRVWTNPFSAR